MILTGTGIYPWRSNSVDLRNSGTINDEAASWTEILASTASAVDGLVLVCTGTYLAPPHNALIDIGVGAFESEEPIAKYLLVSKQQDKSQYQDSRFHIPIRIPAGTRISGRSRQSENVGTHYYEVWGINYADGWRNPFPSLGQHDAKGVDLSSSGGTLVDPGASAWTWPGTWTSLGSATTFTAKMMQIHVGRGYTATADHSIQWNFQIRTSGGVNLVDLRTNASYGSSEPQHWGPFPVNIASGTTLQARCQSDKTVNTNLQRQLELIVYLWG